MVSLSVDGLVSGLDTTSLVSQLVAAEALPQTRLKTQLTTTQAAATAYRAVNSKVDAVRTAAEALTADGLAAARTAKSSATSVSASATSTAVTGSRLSFTVESLASAASYLSASTWASPTTPVRSPSNPDGTAAPSPWPLTISREGQAPVTIEPPAGATLAQTVAHINGLEDLGIRATAVKGSDGYHLQLSSATSGADGDFTVATAAGAQFTQLSFATDATLDLGGGIKATSSTNTFAELMTGVSVTVTERGAAAVVEVAEDPKSVSAKVKTLVDAVNSALDSIKTHSNSETDSKAVLKGDFELRTLTSELLQNVSSAVSGAGSPGAIGIELTRDGTVVFDETTFLAALASDPDLVERMLAGAPADPTAAPPVTAVDGLSQRLQKLTERFADSTTGTLTLLAKGRDALAEDFKDRIADWDLRLATRKETLTRQFTAMETALSSLRNQSTWLAGQLNALPSSS
ncbi:flagellar filament capping protein FliD [Geodermatophilus sp. DSM 45219]|uniref:flagellar filament capping protein FliD n=1 Tax=Geodermatophilus sp. DSM 45219 TaxID=1881103 RepID=UPI000884FFDF|nr:flagellar filament capping protein FliD [Geodermatophilus sp. DSM 45219]SDN43501.1 flagellar hook-associated protein 2 [Geodermatophilus sp. DSM 45219]